MKHLKTASNILLVCATLGAIGVGAAHGAERGTPRTAAIEAQLTAGATVWAGQVVGQKSGYAYPYISSSTDLAVVGVAQNSTASNGIVRVRAGIFGLKNLGTVTAAHIGAAAYAATNNTAWTAAPSGTAAIGKIMAVDADYVWVDTYHDSPLISTSVATLAITGNSAVGGTLGVTGAATFANAAIVFAALPTSTNGLASGRLWNSSGTVKVIP